MSLIRITRDDLSRIMAIAIWRWSNMHAHGRYNILPERMLDTVVPDIIRHAKYALFMPNNGPDEGGIIRTVESAERIHGEIMALRDRLGIATFTDAMMTVYLTRDTTPAMIERIARSDVVWAVKSYPTDPAGTTNAGHGIPFDECDETIRAMIEHDVPLLVHAEDTHDRYGRELPHSEREAHCVEYRLRPFREKYPALRLCGEHASTASLIRLVREDKSMRTVCTITPHHMLFTPRDLTVHLKCMPIVKEDEDRAEVADFATSGDPRAIAGDDTAPHAARTKRVAFERAKCGCWLPHAVGLYTLAFARADALDDRFVQFMSLNGPRWWGRLPPDPLDILTIKAVSEGDIPKPLRIIGSDDVIVPLGWPDGEFAPEKLDIGFVAHEC